MAKSRSDKKTSKSNQSEILKRIPYGVPQVEPYDVSDILRRSDNFEAIIDRRIALLKKQGLDITSCPEYLDSIIEEYITALLSSLERKHSINQHFIKNIFVRRVADKAEYERLLNEFDVQIAATEAEFNFVEALYEKHNPLYEGRLKSKPFSIGEEDEESDEEEDDNG